MFRDQIWQAIPEGQTDVRANQREINELFYTGLLIAAKYLLQSKGPEDLGKRAADCFNEAEAYTYEKHRKEAQDLIAKHGLGDARQRLRAIALDRGLTPGQASIVFGIDMNKFDNIQEIVNLTRALRNRGIDFRLDMNNTNHGFDHNSEYGAKVVGGSPEQLSAMCGGAKVNDLRTAPKPEDLDDEDEDYDMLNEAVGRALDDLTGVPQPGGGSQSTQQSKPHLHSSTDALRRAVNDMPGETIILKNLNPRAG